jgi:hypothetical protein
VQAAQDGQCPAESRIGTGTVDVQVDGPFPYAFGAGAYRGTTETFLAAPRQAGDIAGLVVKLTIAGQSTTATGRVIPFPTAPYGVELRYDPLPQPTLVPPGYTIRLQALRSEVRARRTVRRVRYRRVRRRGRAVRIRVVRKIRYDLIRTPATCTGSWPVQVAVRYAGRVDLLDAPIACTAG